MSKIIVFCQFDIEKGSKEYLAILFEPFEIIVIKSI